MLPLRLGLLVISSWALLACTSSNEPDGDADPDDDDAPDVCAEIGSFTIRGALAPTVDLRAGTSVGLKARSSDLETDIIGIPAEVTGCAIAWSVETPGGVTIDQNGLLTADASATPGSVHVVTAMLEGRLTASVEAWVYTPETHPQVGLWHEAARISCNDGSETAPSNGEAIGELRIAASGYTPVTWPPFETYVDYWANVNYASGSASFSAPEGNHVPTDIDASGTYEVDGTNLVLRDMFLGTRNEPGAPACGHRFTR